MVLKLFRKGGFFFCAKYWPHDHNLFPLSCAEEMKASFVYDIAVGKLIFLNLFL